MTSCIRPMIYIVVIILVCLFPFKSLSYSPKSTWKLNSFPSLHPRRSSSLSSRLNAISTNDMGGAETLHRLVAKKKLEVKQLEEKHKSTTDPIQMRMSYAATENRMNVSRALIRDTVGKERSHTMSIIVDMKRRSPTIPTKREILNFPNAGQFAELLCLAGADAIMFNTEESEYGGKYEELIRVTKSLQEIRPNNPIPCIVKDIIIHPIQIARALVDGATGVLLIACVVGDDLEALLDACTIMGTEAIVEVHSSNELDYALSKGATMFLMNTWDRVTGLHHPTKATDLARFFPMNTIAIAAGNINHIDRVSQLGYYGYESVVLGRGITEIDDVKGFIQQVHGFRGLPRDPRITFGQKGLPWEM